MTQDARRLFYPVWVANGRKEPGWSWGRPCDSSAEASQVVAEVMADRPLTSLGGVVAFAGGEAIPLRDSILPAGARTVIALWDALEDLAEVLPDRGEVPCCWQAWTERGAWRLGEPERDPASCGRGVVARVRGEAASAAPGGPPLLAAKIVRSAPGATPIVHRLWPWSACKVGRRWDELWDATDAEAASR